MRQSETPADLTLTESSAPAAPQRRRGVAIGVGGAAVLLAALDAYVVVTVLSNIGSDLGLVVNHLEEFTPIVTGYLLGYVAGMPLLGGISDVLGRRTVIQFCLGGFLVGSVITALAETLPWIVAGRAIQGLAGGALLPVTMALAGDLWDQRRRPVILGTVGAAQELGSVLGPLYGAWLAAAFATWRGIFWVNVPLAALAIVAVQFALPGRRAESRANGRRVDVVGGTLLAISLGLLVVGLYNPNPEKSVLPSWGVPTIAAGGGVLLLFAIWETFARQRLVDLSGVAKAPFFATIGASLLAGAALMVTLVDIQIVAQGQLGLDSTGGALILTRFLIALPIGAVLGGVLAPRLGERWVAVAGFLIAGAGYWLIATWPIDPLSARHEFLGLNLPRLDTDLAVAGLGLGLVIAPLSSAVLRVIPAVQHGVASAAVVVARTMGMLIGLAALSAWGLHRFQVITADLKTPLPDPSMTDQEYASRMNIYEDKLIGALHQEFSEIFLITAVICVAGAVVVLALAGRRHAAKAAA
jgi:MFS family permease